jgi:cell wall-associated NlpC family hydrolase
MRRGTVRSVIVLVAMLGAASPVHAGGASAVPAGAPLSATILRMAHSLGGRPYRWAGAGPRVFDCSGLVAHIYAALGRQLPHSSFAQYQFGEAVSRLDLAAGDLVFFRTYRPGPSHVGIYIGGGRFVHVSYSRGVIISSIEDPYFNGRFIGARRI